jgi:predicted DNA-binding transcriptional regulator AlpA
MPAQRQKRNKEACDRRRQIIRWKRLLQILPYSETEIREQYLNTGRLRRVPLGPRAVGFVEDEAWEIVDELIEARDAALAQEREVPLCEARKPLALQTAVSVAARVSPVQERESAAPRRRRQGSDDLSLVST